MDFPFDRNLIDPNPTPPRPNKVLGAMVVFFCCMIIGVVVIVAIKYDMDQPKVGGVLGNDVAPVANQGADMDWFNRKFLQALAISGFIGLLVLCRRRSPVEKEEEPADDLYYR